MQSNNGSAGIERMFAALADRTRLRLLSLMGEQEVCVCYFVEILRLPQPKISRHLAYLRRTGMVTARREGKWMHYRIAVPENRFARRLLAQTLHWLGEHEDLQRDRARLARATCVPQKFIRLQRAPTPIRAHRLISEGS